MVLACIVLGARIGGIGLGMAGGVGLFVLSFFFSVRPAPPPIDVMLIITAVVTATATLQAGGGLDYLVRLAERVLRRSPARITFVAPAMTYLSTAFCGTGYVSLALFPVIAEVAAAAGIRPERPLSIALVSIQQAITVSPVSAAMAVMISVMAPFGIALGEILLVTIPATLVGCTLGALAVYRRGVELADDPVSRERLASGEFQRVDCGLAQRPPVPPYARRAVLVFAGLVVAVILMGSVDALRPSWSGEDGVVKMGAPMAIEILMLAGACLIAVTCRVKAADVTKNPVFQSGMMGVVSVFGVAWMMESFFTAHRPVLTAAMADMVAAEPLSFALVLFLTSALLFSQGAAVRAMVPLGLSLGIPAVNLTAMFTACAGYFLIPTGGLTIACVAFDRTGTTRIGKGLLNHSFMWPGLVAVASSLLVGALMLPLLR